MKQVIRLILAVLIFSLWQRQGNAQWFRGGGYGGVGTAYSAEQHGMADIVRSEGMYNVMTSRAMVNYEEARGKYLDNSRKSIDVYLYRKRMLESEKAKERRATRESVAHYVKYRAANPDLPPRLRESQLNTVTGEIKWPSALKRVCFANSRQEMEALIAAKAQTGTTSELNTAIFKKSRELQAELRSQARDIVVREFIQARRFLESLATEGTVPRDE